LIFNLTYNYIDDKYLNWNTIFLQSNKLKYDHYAKFSSDDQNIIDVPFLSVGYWYNAINYNDTLYTEDGNYDEYTIPAKNAVIYMNNQYQLSINSPEAKIYPERFLLFSAYPNPFNSIITFQIKSKDNFVGGLNIYDLTGKKVYAYNKIEIRPGENNYSWHGIDLKGMSVPSGLYFVVLNKGTQTFNQKILLIK